MRGGAAALAFGSGLVFVGSGAYIFWNTNVLNRYSTQPQEEATTAEAEKALLAFEKLAQPRIVGVTLNVELFPREAKAVTTGTYELENRSGQRISEIHLPSMPKLRLEQVDVPGATLKTDNAQ